MRRPLSLLATAAIVAGSVLVAAPAASAAPTLDPTTQRFADFTFSLSDTTDLVPEQDGLTLTITKSGTDPLCQRYDVDSASWLESGNGDPVNLYLALFAVDGDTYTPVGEPIQAFDNGMNNTYTTGAASLTAEFDLERILVPGPYVAYAICEDAFSGDRQYSSAAAELDVAFTPFTFSPSPTPAGSTTILTVPRPDLWCSIDSIAAGHSVVIFYATNPADLVDGSPQRLPAGWEEELPALGSFNPDTTEPITVPITLPSDIAEGTYSVAIQCVGPEAEEYLESGSARYFGTLTVGPLAEPEPEAPTLPETGAAEAWAIGLVAAALLTAGVVLMTPRRRASTR